MDLRRALRWGPLFAVGLSVLTLPALVAWPADRVAHIGFVSPASPERNPRIIAAFWERLHELGYVEGKNLLVDSRWAEGRVDKLPALMAEVVARNPDVIVTFATYPALAARNATHTIPIIVAAMGDPVATGLATSLARPGGNLTGLSMGYADPVSGKWLEILRDMVPDLSKVILIMNLENPLERNLRDKLMALAAAQHLKLEAMEGSTPEALRKAFEHAPKRARGIIVTGDPVLDQARIIRLAVKYRIPAVYAMREPVDDGGLAAYGPDVKAMFRRAAEYVDKILKGASPSELPIEQPTRYALVLNMKAAKAIGLTIPPDLEMRADEVLR